MYLPLCYGEEVSGRMDGWREWDGMGWDGMEWDAGVWVCGGGGRMEGLMGE